MNIIGIQNPKLTVTNDYQQFLAHFEWFLALFQISDVKPELSPVKLKSIQKCQRLYLLPNQSYGKKSSQNGH